MSLSSRWSAVLTATVTAALTGALLSAPTAAHAASSPAPKASHVKACKKADFSGASRMRLQSSKKAVGKSGRSKVTARAYVYTNKDQQACIVTTATSPKVKKTKKTVDIFHVASSIVLNDAVIKFEGGHQFNSNDPWGDSHSSFGSKPPRSIGASVVDLAEEGVMTAEDLEYFPAGMENLEGQKYRMDVKSLRVHWHLTAERTVKTKKVSKAKAAKARKAKIKKIDARRKSGLRKARTTWQEWVAAQPQTTPEERVWVKEFGDLIHDFERTVVTSQAGADKAMARYAAKEAVRGRKTVKAYGIKIDLPLALPRLG